MPQISPIMWLIPTILLIYLMLMAKASMMPTKEYESKVLLKKSSTTSMKWKW